MKEHLQGAQKEKILRRFTQRSFEMLCVLVYNLQVHTEVDDQHVICRAHLFMFVFIKFFVNLNLADVFGLKIKLFMRESVWLSNKSHIII